MEKHIKSKQRVADFGEVLTPPWLVNAMLDLVKHETERIDSRFLEPACGTGNFLTEILTRKLTVVERRYHHLQLDYERYAVLAVSSLYGIDILEDNVLECRHQLATIVQQRHTALYPKTPNPKFLKTVRFILERNIIWGDALTLKTVGENPEPIIFSEWSLVNGVMLKRRDFAFHTLLEHQSLKETPLFSGLDEDVFIPEPIREYPPVHFLEVANVQGGRTQPRCAVVLGELEQ
ncbi:MAG: SAM-dependent DNA methyltransferase [Fimbriimonadales bacterium]